jgi:cytochrome oxidase assembly protein ShyY1
MARQFQRRGDVFQRRHRRDKVEGLEHHPHMIATEAGQLILVHRGQIAPQRRHLPAGGPFEAAHEHEERGFARPRRPRQCDRFATRHRKRNAVQDIDRARVAVERQACILQDQNGIFHD